MEKNVPQMAFSTLTHAFHNFVELSAYSACTQSQCICVYTFVYVCMYAHIHINVY